MGKKVKKTKWRTLEISAPGKNVENVSKWDDVRRYTASKDYQQYDRPYRRKASSSISPSANSSHTNSSKEEMKVFDEDEYTKITTPRQDVLFKKGYLSRKRAPETISENCSGDQNVDGIAQDCSSNEDFSNHISESECIQQFMCPGSQSYIDPSTLYYGGGYEIYDPYTGNVTVIVSNAAGQYSTNSTCQSMLTSVPCTPVPLQSVQWFNPIPPSTEWCCSYSSQSDKRYSTDSQNGSGIGSESSGAPETPPDMIEDSLGSVFSPPYVYPGYMFGAPIYNLDDASPQYFAPESSGLSSSDVITSKRKRKRKRRRRTEAEEESESSFDDNCSRSISSTDCMPDSRSQTASQDYEDDLKNHTSYYSGPLCYSNLPHANVNAPEFIPAEYSSPLTLPSQKPTSPDRHVVISSVAADSCDSNELLAPENFANAKSSVGPNVYCKPFDNRSAKRDLEMVSCSNNSDSGISSPGSEDISKNSFGNKEDKNQNDCDVKNKPRSRKSKGKSKLGEEVTKSEPQPSLKKDNQKNFNPRKEVKKEEKKEPTKTTPFAKKETASKIDAATVKQKKKSGKKIQKKKCCQNVKLATKKEGVVSHPDNQISTDVQQCIEKLHELVIDESGNRLHENDMLMSRRDRLDNCLLVDNSRHVTEVPSEISCPSLPAKVETILEECMKIEEKPVLAKLVDLNQIPEHADVTEEINSISEFSSSRKSLDSEKDQKKQLFVEVQLAAEQMVNEVIECAEERVLSSVSCDKLQLPITQAVTKWLNEHGGLPTVIDNEDIGSQCDSDSRFGFMPKSSKKIKQNCVIC